MAADHPLPTTAPPTPASGTATPSPTAPTGPGRGRCSRRSGSRTTTSRSRSSASPRRGSRRCPATSTSAGWRSRSRRASGPAGGTPMEFNTIAVSDGVSMGTEGMKASLISREVIADSIELVARGPPVRRDRVPRRLRQDDPGRRDGAGPARDPRARPLQRHDLPGHLQGRAGRHRVGVRGDRRLPGRQDHARGAVRGRGGRLPRRRRLRRPVHGQHDGDRAASSSACRRAGSTGSRPRTRRRTTPRAGPASS